MPPPSRHPAWTARPSPRPRRNGCGRPRAPPRCSTGCPRAARACARATVHHRRAGSPRPAWPPPRRPPRAPGAPCRRPSHRRRRRRRTSGSGAGVDDRATLVVAAHHADMVGHHGSRAARAATEARRLDRMSGASLVTTGTGRLALGNGQRGSCQGPGPERRGRLAPQPRYGQAVRAERIMRGHPPPPRGARATRRGPPTAGRRRRRCTRTTPR